MVDAGIVSKLDGLIDRYRLVRAFLYIFIFFQPFSHFASIRSVSFVLLLLAFLVKSAAGKTSVDFRDRTVQAFSVLFIICVLSALFSPYKMDSLDAIRKNLLYQAFVFVVIINEFRTMEDLKTLFYAMFAGFAALSLIIIIKNDSSVLLNWLDNSGKRETFLSGYSIYATFYIPLAVAYLISVKESTAFKVVLIAFLFLEFVLSMLNNHRAQIGAFGASVVLISIMARKYKFIIAALIICTAAGLAIYSVKPDSLDRYKTMLYAKTYVTNEHEGLNNRLAIWDGMVEMIKDRPVAGYGYGWKKVALAVNDGGYLEKWDKNGEKYKYFTGHTYGQINPHNLPLQILFEVGILGAIAFVAFWATVAMRAASVMAGGLKGEAADFLKYGITGVLLSYVIINAVNGLWEESMGILMVSFAASCIVLYREAFAGNTGVEFIARDEVKWKLKA